MADDVTLPGTGDIVAADEIGGSKYQRVKLIYGDNGVNAGDVSTANPLPVSLASVPSHAVTNAGTFPVQVDGSALTSLQLIDDVVLAEDAIHSSGDKGVMSLAVRADADAALSSSGDYHPLIVNEEGRLKVSTVPADLAATTGTITANAQTVVVDVTKASNVCLYVTGTFSTINLTFEASIDGGTTWFAVQMVRSNANTVELTTGNLSAAPAYSWEASVNAYTNFRVRATAFTSGTMNVRILPGVYATEPVIATQTTPVTVSSGTVTTVTNITNQGHIADNAAFTDGTTRLMMNGYIFDEVAGTALTENDGAAARVDNKRAQVHVIEDATTRGQRLAVNAAGAAAVNHVAATAGGATMARIKTGASNNLTSVKASAGQVYGYHLFNRTAGELFVKLYNKASAPVVASDTPVYTIPLPPYGGVALTFPMGIAFKTGIAYAIVGGVADTNATSTAADDVHGVLLYA